jgi:hypothetical protein
MKKLRNHPLFLVAVALAIPLGVAFLYYDFYDGNDLVFYKQISVADNGDVLSFLRKHPKAAIAPDEHIRSAGFNLYETRSVQSAHPVLISQKCSVLRC